ncbi:unnamed protein product [Arctogadus glacialis]
MAAGIQGRATATETLLPVWLGKKTAERHPSEASARPRAPAVFLTVHGSLSGHALNQGAPPNVPPWCGVNGANLGPRCNDGGLAAVANGNSGARPPTEDPGPLTETGAGSRSPINTDELLIERLEQRLLERESELQDLQVSFEEKEENTCQLFEERQRAEKERLQEDIAKLTQGEGAG